MGIEIYTAGYQAGVIVLLYIITIRVLKYVSSIRNEHCKEALYTHYMGIEICIRLAAVLKS